ncbi:hypothetical protein, partial [Escherichia coli]|uniref:hypothetical protein n=1 Tax=Escherichia coli TaxID=562 RepID=UPI0019D60A04
MSAWRYIAAGARASHGEERGETWTFVPGLPIFHREAWGGSDRTMEPSALRIVTYNVRYFGHM